MSDLIPKRLIVCLNIGRDKEWKFFNLMNPYGELKKYQGFKIKPQVGNLIHPL